MASTPRRQRSKLVSFLVQLALSAGVLWLGVAWVAPHNPSNTVGRAVVVSLVLTVAYVLTGGLWLHLLVIPWLVYAAIWLVVIMGAYGLGFFHALLLALALALLSWVASRLLGIKPLRS